MRISRVFTTFTVFCQRSRRRRRSEWVSFSFVRRTSFACLPVVIFECRLRRPARVSCRADVVKARDVACTETSTGATSLKPLSDYTRHDVTRRQETCRVVPRRFRTFGRNVKLSRRNDKTPSNSDHALNSGSRCRGLRVLVRNVCGVIDIDTSPGTWTLNSNHLLA